MAVRAVPKPHPALEVHLPQKVRLCFLETLVAPGRTDRSDHATVPAQDLMDRRKRRRLPALLLERECDLAGSPGRMGVAHRQHRFLGGRIAAARAYMRPVRAIGQSL